MKGYISLIDQEKKAIMINNIKNINSFDDLIYRILEIHNTPLTFNDICKILREMKGNEKLNNIIGKINNDKINDSLKRLIKRREIQRMYCINNGRPIIAYALRTDCDILSFIPIKILKEEGYKVYVGFSNERERKPYDLYEVNHDYLIIHINKDSTKYIKSR